MWSIHLKCLTRILTSLYIISILSWLTNPMLLCNLMEEINEWMNAVNQWWGDCESLGEQKLGSWFGVTLQSMLALMPMNFVNRTTFSDQRPAQTCRGPGVRCCHPSWCRDYEMPCNAATCCGLYSYERQYANQLNGLCDLKFCVCNSAFLCHGLPTSCHWRM